MLWENLWVEEEEQALEEQTTLDRRLAWLGFPPTSSPWPGWEAQCQAAPSFEGKVPPSYLHAVGEHDTDGHHLGKNLQEFRIGEHAIFQAIVQEAGVVGQYVVYVGGLQSERVFQNDFEGFFSFSSDLSFPF